MTSFWVLFWSIEFLSYFHICIFFFLPFLLFPLFFMIVIPLCLFYYFMKCFLLFFILFYYRIPFISLQNWNSLFFTISPPFFSPFYFIFLFSFSQFFPQFHKDFMIKFILRKQNIYFLILLFFWARGSAVFVYFYFECFVYKKDTFIFLTAARLFLIIFLFHQWNL